MAYHFIVFTTQEMVVEFRRNKENFQISLILNIEGYVTRWNELRSRFSAVIVISVTMKEVIVYYRIENKYCEL